MSGIHEILSASRNGSAACRNEFRDIFSIAPAVSWSRWSVVGCCTAGTRVRAQTSHFGFVGRGSVTGHALPPQILAARSLTYLTAAVKSQRFEASLNSTLWSPRVDIWQCSCCQWQAVASVSCS
jgi:hypothetical protein